MRISRATAGYGPTGLRTDDCQAQRDGGAEEMTEPDGTLLMAQFLRWVAERPRTYTDVMDAWRTSCPRQSVWEDAQLGGLVEFDGEVVTLTAHGAAMLVRVGRTPPIAPDV